MGLNEIFDGLVREVGRSDTGALLRAGDDSIDHLFRGSEKRCKARYMEQQRQRTQQSNSSNGSGGGMGSLLLGAAFLGGLALLCGSGDGKNSTSNAK